jgi:nucleotide-binding universal stress UspA family protein
MAGIGQSSIGQGGASRELDVRHAVVVGCDGQPESDAALRFAVREASLRSARLVMVMSFFKPIDPDLDEYDTPESELRSRALRTAEASLCRALSLAPEHLPIHQTVTGQGEPSRVLLHDYGTAELFVLGSHHRNLVKRVFSGHATSRTLIHQGHVPVVVVPPDWIAPTADDV